MQIMSNVQVCFIADESHFCLNLILFDKLRNALIDHTFSPITFHALLLLDKIYLINIFF